MISKKIVLIILAFNFILSETVIGNAGHWAVWEGYGLGIDFEENKYPIITYIPRTFLLFDIATQNRMINDQEYKEVTTQDGVRLYMLSKSISKKPIKQGLGFSSIIFNTKASICLEKHCQNRDEEMLQIIAGEFFEKSQEGNLIRLKGTRGGETIEGIVNENQLNEWNKEGKITFADQAQPRLEVTQSEGKYFNLECGMSRESNEELKGVDENEIQNDDEIINKIYDIANIVQTQNKDFIVTFNRPYGGTDTMYKYRIYKVKNLQQDTERKYAAQIVYECEVSGNSVNLKRITEVSLKYAENSNAIMLKPEGTPDNLKKWTGSPHYLYSVNNTEQYFALMSKLGDMFSNRAEAGFFLSEFNRSCRSKHRKKKNCTHHDYTSDEL